MIETQALTTHNINRLKPMYQLFQTLAKTDYHWHDTPVDFDQLKSFVISGGMQGFLAIDGVEETVLGFMLYTVTDYAAIELNVIYIPSDAPWKTLFDIMMRGFLRQIEPLHHWKTVSYPMLGVQSRFVLTSGWYGLQPKGQAIQCFDLMQELSLPVLHKQHTELPKAPDGYTLTTWKPEYTEQIANAIYHSFKKTDDALWDPRFQTLAGAKKALTAITTNQMGVFKPEWTSVMLKDNVPVGFCFVLHTEAIEANIALIGLHPDIQESGLGKQLLRHNLMTLVQGIVDNQWMIGKITATMSTDFSPAIHLYRRFGFQEIDCYPHAYLTRQTAAESYYGREIFTEASAGCCSV